MRRAFVLLLLLCGSFAHALAADPGVDRLQRAEQLAAARRFKEAGAILQALLVREPDNLRAREQLAKIRLRSGDFAAALREAEAILQRSPEHRGALFIKATAWRRQKVYARAIILYRKLLEAEEDFDTRLGLTYALLSSGQYGKARESVRLLQPDDPSQAAELEDLLQALARATSPSTEGQYNLYSDSDGNRVNKYTFLQNLWLRDWKVSAAYTHTEAQGHANTQRADEVMVQTATKGPAGLGISGGVGLTQTGDRQVGQFATGQVKAEIPLGQGKMSASVAREALTSTASLINHQIALTRGGVAFSQALTDRVSVLAEYRYKEYSDQNSAHDAQLTAQYGILTHEPRLDLGYRLRYVDFAQPSQGGYFDPQDFLAHQAFAMLSFERGAYYGSLEPALGYQSFARKGRQTNELFVAGTGTFGIGLLKHLSLELNVEGGTYSLGSATGFNYTSIGARLISVY